MIASNINMHHAIVFVVVYLCIIKYYNNTLVVLVTYDIRAMNHGIDGAMSNGANLIVFQSGKLGMSRSRVWAH